MERKQIPASEKENLIKAVLENDITPQNLNKLAESIDEKDLSKIIQHIYDLNQQQVTRIAALEAILSKVDALKNARRNAYFTREIQKGFRGKPGNTIILAEGDSWFNYPVLLSDVLDWVGMEPDMIVYSLAEGGDWLLNMLSARKYVEQLSVMQPDVFLISAGGNDLVGRSRLSAMIDPAGGGKVEYERNLWAKELIAKAIAKPIVPFKGKRFENGIQYISKDFYALLMFFYLQYYFMISGILESGKFPQIRIITQGYDYAIPDRDKRFGFNPLRWYRPFVRLFLGHGSWLKTPLQLRAIHDKRQQADIIYAMIYLFNEMMIAISNVFCEKPGIGNRVFHIDSRGSVGPDGWSDELHPLPEHFRKTGRTFIDCIRKKPSPHGQVYVVNELNP